MYTVSCTFPYPVQSFFLQVGATHRLRLATDLVFPIVFRVGDILNCPYTEVFDCWVVPRESVSPLTKCGFHILGIVKCSRDRVEVDFYYERDTLLSHASSPSFAVQSSSCTYRYCRCSGPRCVLCQDRTVWAGR